MLNQLIYIELLQFFSTPFYKRRSKKMKDENVGCILATENGGLNGILTDRDITCLAVAEGKDPGSTLIKDTMKADPVFAGPDTDIFEASKRKKSLPPLFSTKKSQKHDLNCHY